MARRLTLFLLVFLILSGSAALAADHDLDPSFSGNGTAIFLERPASAAEALTLQADGRVVVAGTTFTGPDWLLMRATADGQLDTAFGTNGFVSFDFGGFDDGAKDVTMFGNRIVAVGQAWTGTDTAIGLVRLTPGGSPDPTFGGGDGRVSHAPIEGLFTEAVARDRCTGRIVVTGHHSAVGSGGAFIARYLPSGDPDSSFIDSLGIPSLAVNTVGMNEGYAVAIQPDGRPVVAGRYGTDFGAMRRLEGGAADTSFSGDGEVNVDLAGSNDTAFDVALQPDGRIVIAGQGQNPGGYQQFAVVRLNSDGTLDTDSDPDPTSEFSDDGKLLIDFGSAAFGQAVGLTSGGKILIAGQASGETALVRLNQDGSLDNTFAGDGKLTGAEEPAEIVIEAVDMAVQPDGKPVVTGAASDPPSSDFAFGLARYGTQSPVAGSQPCGVPETVIASGPGEGASTTDATPTFGFSSPTPGVTFQCAFDANPFAACSGPGGTHTGPPLAPGSHTFHVRAVDTFAVSDPTPAARSFTVVADQDSDGIADATDNCPADANPTQKDTDADAIGDVCDEDPSLPASCKLRKARSRVFVYTKKNKVRLVVRYRTGGGARVTTTYTALLKGGRKLQIGRLAKSFSAVGTFRLAKNLPKAKMRKVRAAKGFLVVFKIPGTPGSCARFYTKRLTKKRSVSGQKVWFQADSVLTGF